MTQQQLEDLYAKVCVKLKEEAQRTKDTIPFVPIQGRYRDLMIPGGLFWWCNGFYPGILWQMYHATGDEVYREYARAIDRRLEVILENPEKLDHDLGFLILPTLYSEMLEESDREKKEALKAAVVKAADILKAREKEPGFLEAWNPGTLGPVDVSGMMIADTTMNLSLLFHASELTGDESYAKAAIRHADCALKYLVREDGTANHIVKFDLASGEFLGAQPGQGYSPDSVWTRGQGWILYGFTNAYKHTGDEKYLTAAKRSAEICIRELEKRDYLMPVDFAAPADDGKFDSSAAMIIASGLISLASVVVEAGISVVEAEEYSVFAGGTAKETDGSAPGVDESTVASGEKDAYLEAAGKLIEATFAKFGDLDPEKDGMIAGCSNRYHDDRMAGMKIIFADYYFVEAILKLMGKEISIW